MRSYLTQKANRCRACGFGNSVATDITMDGVPRPGAAAVCVQCGALSIFTNSLRLRSPTEEEGIVVETTWIVQAVRQAININPLLPSRYLAQRN